MEVENQTSIQYLSVTELNLLINQSLESCIPYAKVQGEISNLTLAGSGHLYFTLKDQRSQIPAVMWSANVRALRFRPEVGLAVLCEGKPNLYNVSGKLQVVVHRMLPAGAGLLQQKFLQLKAKLEKEGFFAPQRKRRLPFFPKAVGVVTSAKGAVIHDIMVKIRERMPQQKVFLVDVRVQGEGAAQEIADAIDYLGRSGLVDVMIVGRGGGSLEDLWAFNEEAVVKAIFRCPIPVVSGVGHEVDTSLSDLVAEVRGPASTGGGEGVVPRRSDLLQQVAEWERRLCDYERWLLPLAQRVDESEARLHRRMKSLFDEKKAHLITAETRLRLIEPERLFRQLYARIDVLSSNLCRVAARRLAQSEQQLQNLAHRLERSFSPQRISSLHERLCYHERHLARAQEVYFQSKKQQLERLSDKLHAVSPTRVLERGYAMVEKEEGTLVKSSGEVAVGDALRIRLAKGQLSATVSGK